MFNKKYLKNLFIWSLVGVILFFLIRVLLIDIDSLKNYKFRFDWEWMILAFVFYFLAYILASCSFYYMLHNLEYKVPFKNNLAYTIFSQFGTYVPGKVWVYVIRYKLLKKYGIKKQDFLFMFAIDTILLLGSASVVSLLFAGNFIPNKLFINVFLFFIILVTLVCLHPRIFYPASNWFLKKINRPIIKETKQISYYRLIFIFVLNLLYWVFLGIAFFFFSKSVVELGWNRFFDVVGIYVLAVYLGFLAIFIPHGFGVREGIKTAGLASFLPSSVAVLLSLLSRVWSLANEILWSIIMFLVIKQKPFLFDKEELQAEEIIK